MASETTTKTVSLSNKQKIITKSFRLLIKKERYSAQCGRLLKR